MVYALRNSAGGKYQVGIMLRIGRDPANQIVLQDPQVSPFHLTLAEHQGSLLLRDENSNGGTFINQARIQGSVTLQAGDSISIGDTTFTVEQVPEQVFASQSPRQPAKKIGCGCSMWPLFIYILLSLACIVPVFGAYYLYKSPQATQKQFMALIGQGPATIQVENLSDVTVYLFGTFTLDRTQYEDTLKPDFLWEIDSFGTSEKTDQNTGIFRIDFGTQSGEMDLGTCIFDIKSGQVYHFVVLPGYIIVDRTEYPQFFDRSPATVDELVVATSTLCKLR
jgi:hypothetical protein